LAGPVVAAACILPEGYKLAGINDSKKLASPEREKLYQELIQHPEIYYAVGLVEATEIDEVNILQATLKAMAQAIERLKVRPDFVLVDGPQVPPGDFLKEGLVDGDALSQAIAAASVIAKVTRDKIMVGYDALYPEYGFKEHKGYGTSQHLEAIRQHGLSPIHRHTFRRTA